MRLCVRAPTALTRVSWSLVRQRLKAVAAARCPPSAGASNFVPATLFVRVGATVEVECAALATLSTLVSAGRGAVEVWRGPCPRRILSARIGAGARHTVNGVAGVQMGTSRSLRLRRRLYRGFQRVGCRRVDDTDADTRICSATFVGSIQRFVSFRISEHVQTNRDRDFLLGEEEDDDKVFGGWTSFLATWRRLRLFFEPAGPGDGGVRDGDTGAPQAEHAAHFRGRSLSGPGMEILSSRPKEVQASPERYGRAGASGRKLKRLLIDVYFVQEAPGVGGGGAARRVDGMRALGTNCEVGNKRYLDERDDGRPCTARRIKF
ncbi:hypothetical protein HYPSUDRAFT_56463 [Hypholoma sublateritium FD-334 SS-4]|uniref:Uncharacterized protein n=1 Tax=Hypholoma sublateritium (strain FD-334 SS-4) TaxID=945553 RepID=A0A0D2NT49_HYPSF|nr:hypothetical protein HYPSUDRAFT_56463 [Hypholoma sublateritium FD-334 SS-4]